MIHHIAPGAHCLTLIMTPPVATIALSLPWHHLSTGNTAYTSESSHSTPTHYSKLNSTCVPPTVSQLNFIPTASNSPSTAADKVAEIPPRYGSLYRQLYATSTNKCHTELPSPILAELKRLNCQWSHLLTIVPAHITISNHNPKQPSTICLRKLNTIAKLGTIYSGALEAN